MRRRLAVSWGSQLTPLYLPLMPRGHLVFASKNTCPFMRMRLHPQANQQVYSRQELYRARPPHVLEPSGFHTERSLAVYQGLVYYLLWLHSKYDKVRAPEAVVQGAGSPLTAGDREGASWHCSGARPRTQQAWWDPRTRLTASRAGSSRAIHHRVGKRTGDSRDWGC